MDGETNGGLQSIAKERKLRLKRSSDEDTEAKLLKEVHKLRAELKLTHEKASRYKSSLDAYQDRMTDIERQAAIENHRSFITSRGMDNRTNRTREGAVLFIRHLEIERIPQSMETACNLELGVTLLNKTLSPSEQRVIASTTTINDMDLERGMPSGERRRDNTVLNSFLMSDTAISLLRGNIRDMVNNHAAGALTQIIEDLVREQLLRQSRRPEVTTMAVFEGFHSTE